MRVEARGERRGRAARSVKSAIAKAVVKVSLLPALARRAAVGCAVLGGRSQTIQFVVGITLQGHKTVIAPALIRWA
jgi:hypothetical protein